MADGIQMDLTPEEVAIIEARRAEKAAVAAHKQRVLELLKASAEFYAWMQETGGGVTFSMFCNDFGYDAAEGIDRSVLFKQVEKLLEFATEITR